MCDRDTRKVTLSLVSTQEEILPWRHFYSNFCSAKAHSREFTMLLFSQVPFCGITLIYVVYRHMAMWTFYFLPLMIWLLWLLHRTRFAALACQWLACSMQSSVLECCPCHSVFLNSLSREQPCCTCAALCLSVFWWARAICMQRLSCGQYWRKRISSRHYFWLLGYTQCRNAISGNSIFNLGGLSVRSLHIHTKASSPTHVRTCRLHRF